MLNLRTFCITLPECPERKEKARKHFQERGLTDVTFFDGIHAEKFGLKTCYPYERDHPGSGFNMGFKCTGIWLSHWVLWSALNLLWEDAYIILEDDCCFPEDWHPRLSKALEDMPSDWDLLWFGACCCADKPKTHIKGEVYDLRYPLCSHAYAVSKKALPVLLATQRKCYAPLDIAVALHSMPKLKTYTVFPTICSQFDTILSP